MSPTAQTNFRWLPLVIVILAFIGFADAAYLTAEHFLGATPVCLISHGCDTVLTSRYASIGPIPLSLVGVLYYLVVFLGAVTLVDRNKLTHSRMVKFLSIITGLGFLSSLGLVYLQLFVLHAICFYCMVSATTTTLLFSSLVWYKKIVA